MSSRDYDRERPGDYDEDRWRYGERRRFGESGQQRGPYGYERWRRERAPWEYQGRPFEEGDWEHGGFERESTFGREGGFRWQPRQWRGEAPFGYGERGQGYFGEGEWPERGYGGYGYGGRQPGWGSRQYGWGGGEYQPTYPREYGWEGGMGERGRGGRLGEFAGRGPKNYQRSDERIKEDVNDRLTDHPDIDPTDINVEVRGGEVMLTGEVNSRWDKRLAEDIAWQISGIKNIHNQLSVRSYAQMGREEQRQAA